MNEQQESNMPVLPIINASIEKMIQVEEEKQKELDTILQIKAKEDLYIFNKYIYFVQFCSISFLHLKPYHITISFVNTIMTQA